jgi:BirA family biotin operon repressor/biotin-[acetyl-CoA-carboxylase] ligase
MPLVLQRRKDDGSPSGAYAGATLRWPTEALWAQLEPLCPGLSVEVLAETDSSNTRLMERARIGETAPCLLVAQRQTAGRGRMGRAWRSATHGETGASLTFSLGLMLDPADWAGLSLAVGVALAEALHPGVGLKWPNDLWFGAKGDVPGRKLGGVLVETLGVNGGRYVVIGVGLNVAEPPRMQGDEFSAAWVREFDPTASAPALLGRIALPLLQSVLRFEREGFRAFAGRFARADILLGRPVVTTSADAPAGIAQGVDEQGALRVQTPSGAIVTIGSGEVSVRPC